LPAANRMNGFKGAFLMVERKSGKLVGITLWNSEKDLQASTGVIDKLRAQASKDISDAKPPIIEIYEVVLQA
jgi:heme-degrading monooxygenase HmoA